MKQNNKDYSIKTLSRIAELRTSKSINLGFLYLLEINGKIKFGKTKNLESRLQTYKSHSGEYPKVIDFWFGIDYSNLQSQVKHDFKGKGLTEEWFEKTYKNQLKEKFELLSK